MEHRILVVDDDLTIRTILARVLEDEGHTVAQALSGEEALGIAQQERPDLALLDIGLPGIDGLEVLSRLRRDVPEIAVVMITAQTSVKTAVAAMRAGARNYLAKPFGPDEIRAVVGEALETVRLRREVQIHRDTQRRSVDLESIVGESEGFQAVLSLAGRVALSESTTVLIEGESGTGKEIIARLIHYRSGRSAGPFVAINCGAIPRDLVESELFGHERGAFTGAVQARTGKFEAADGGTLFLDEVGELAPDSQIQLLRVLEDHTICRVGGTKHTQIDVRVLAATNVTLDERVASGRFREDLFYRLNVAAIQIPPLRERQADIVPLARRFLSEFSRAFGKSMTGIAPGAETRLLDYPWRGNVRELRNAVERIVLLEDGDTLTEAHLRFLGGRQPELPLGQQRGEGYRLPPEGVVLEEVNRDLIRQALDLAGGNQVKAAKLLGLSRGTLRYRLEKYGLPSTTPR